MSKCSNCQIDCTMDSVVSVQGEFIKCGKCTVKEQQAEIARLTAELAALKSPQEPFGYYWENPKTGEDGIIRSEASLGNVPDIIYSDEELKDKGWMKVYAAPPLREGWVSVPREPTHKLLEILWQFRKSQFKDARDAYSELIAAASEEGK